MKTAGFVSLSRNTVSLALRVLVDKGLLISSSRSRLIANGDTLLGQAHQATPLAAVQSGLRWDARPVSRMERRRNIMKPANWQDYAYPASDMPQRPCGTTLDRSSFQACAAGWGGGQGGSSVDFRRQRAAAHACRGASGWAGMPWRMRADRRAEDVLTQPLTNGRACGAATSR
jgi:hypothetical protein